jgi:fructoselysine 6-kinase
MLYIVINVICQKKEATGMRFAAAGFICVDYYTNLGGRCYPTGNGVDVLYNLMSMRDDIEGAVISAVGDDEYGKLLRDSFEERGIDISRLETVEGASTASFGMLLNGRDRVHAFPNKGVMDGYRFSDDAVRYAAGFDCVHVDYQSELCTRLPEIASEGAMIFFDFTKIRGNDPRAENIYPYLKAGLGSFEEDGEELRSFLRHGCERGAKIMIGTMGEKGSVAFDGERFYECGIVETEHLENTVGAGDSYFAGFISALLDGKSVPECMMSGAARASRVVSHFEPYF